MGKRRRIAIFAERFPPHGGGGISAAHYNLYQLLREQYEIKLFAFDDSANGNEENVVRAGGRSLLGVFLEFGLTRYVRHFERSGRICCCPRIARTIGNIRKLSRALARFSPDIVIVSDDQLPLLGMRKPKGAKTIWIAHHNYARFRHQPLIDGPCDYDLFLAHRLERRAVRKCDHAIFVSRYMEKVFREKLDSDIPGTVIYNYFDLRSRSYNDLQARRHELGFEPEDIVIFIPSGGTQVKGARFVPEIVRRLSMGPNTVRFCVTGPIEARLRYELDYLKDSHHICTPGPVDHNENLRIMSACDLCVSPALIENFSCGLLECLAFGIPCIAFDVGGNSELIENQASGHVVPYLDIDRLCETASVLIRDAGQRNQYSEAAKQSVLKFCDATHVATQYNELFDEMLAG